MEQERHANKDIYDAFGVSAYHDRGILGANVSVYIIDTGLKNVHPDVNHVIVETFADEGTSSVHGSAVAALLSARENGFGIVGVAPQATVYLADVDDSNAEIWDNTVAQALYAAYLRNVDIISISLSTTTYSSILAQAVQTCVSAGILVFAAAGNSGRVQYEYPSSLPGVISVASCNNSRQISTFTTRNDRVSIFAPGEGILLPDTEGNLVAFSGTSFSAPFAAGLAALDLSERRPQNEYLSRVQIVSFVNETLGTTRLLPATTSESEKAWSLIFAVAFGLVLIVAVTFYVRRESVKS
jgi:subtilisin family serine protease